MDYIDPLEVIDGQTLMDKAFLQMHFVVKGLLMQGLTMLAGAPKTGKSWFALWLCLSVAKGEPLWDLETKQGTVLYLCLEDNYQRIQNRLYEIAEDAPQNLFFAVNSCQIGNGLEMQIENFVQQHQDTVLIVIDTFQFIRPQGADYSYANDYRDLIALKELAYRFSISILLIHHLRKEAEKDSFHMISGTTGIQGAVDSCFILAEEKRGEGKALLSCIGRDIAYREITLKRNENHIWEKIKDSLDDEKETDSIAEIISQYMESRGEIFLSAEPKTLAELLSDSSGEEISNLSLLKRMKRQEEEIQKAGYSFQTRRSNGRRLIEIYKISDGGTEKEAVRQG